MDSAEQYDVVHCWASEPSHESTNKTKHKRLLQLGNSITYDTVQVASCPRKMNTHDSDNHRLLLSIYLYSFVLFFYLQ